MYFKVKVKVQIKILISSLKTHEPTLPPGHCMNLFIHVVFQLHEKHTVLQPFGRIKLIVHIFSFVLPGTHLLLSQVKHVRGGI